MNRCKLILFLFAVFNMRSIILVDNTLQNYIPEYAYNEEKRPLGYLALYTDSRNPKYDRTQVYALLQERDDMSKTIERFKFEYRGKKLTDSEILTLERLRLILEKLVARIGLQNAISLFINFQNKFSQMNSGIVADLPADDMLPYYKEMLETFDQGLVKNVERQELLCEILSIELIEKLEKEHTE